MEPRLNPVSDKPKVLCIGNPVYDKSRYTTNCFLAEHNITVSGTGVEMDLERVNGIWRSAKEQSKEKISGRCGGAINIMTPLLLLGHLECSVIGRIGNDKRGEKVERLLAEMHGTSLLIKSNEPTGKALCFITPDRRRSMLTHLGAMAELNKDDIQEDPFTKHEHAHIDGYLFFFGIVDKIVQLAGKNHLTTSLVLPTKDVVQMFRNTMLPLVPSINYIFGTVNEILTLTGVTSITDALESFPMQQTVVATNGHRGFWVKESGKKMAAFHAVPQVDPEKIVNKTGAGDRFAGIYLALALQGKSPETCADMAKQGAADWIQQPPGTYTEGKTWAAYKAVCDGKNSSAKSAEEALPI